MIQINNYLALIPARKNSKRIINKNILKINGKKVVEYTIKAALNSKKINHTIISTDSKVILNMRKHFNASFIKRPKHLALAKSSTEDVIIDIIKKLNQKKIKFKNIVLLQPTSPLRNYKHIDQCIKIFEQKKLDSIFSACKKKIFVWEKRKKNLNSITFNYKKRQRTQTMRNFFIENGAIFIFSVQKFLKYKRRIFGKFGIYEMKYLDSFDLDDNEDLEIIKLIMRKNEKKFI